MKIGVGAIIINEDDKILLQKRTDKVKVYKNCWFIPCGVVEYNENPIQALKREIKEELNVNVEVIKEISKRFDNHTNTFVIAYLCKINDHPKIMEPEKCSELKYFFINALPPNTGKPVIEFLKIYKNQIKN